MSIEKGNINDVEESDLTELIENEVAEGLYLDYKAKNYDFKNDKKDNYIELLKDVSSFANAAGGHLILGISEKDGLPHKLIGIDDDFDSVERKIRGILDKGLEPRLLGVGIHRVSLSNKRAAIIIRIPRSWNAPHRVVRRECLKLAVEKGKDPAVPTNRFYIRSGAQSREASLEELRVMFNQSPSVINKAKSFRDERLRAIQEGEGIPALEDSGRFVIHLIPFSSMRGEVSINFSEMENRRKAFDSFVGNTKRRFNYYGSINEWGKEHGYTQLFKNGCVESVVVCSDEEIESGFLEGLVFGEDNSGLEHPNLKTYFENLRDNGVSTPVAVFFSLLNATGKIYYIKEKDNKRHPAPPEIPSDRLILPLCIVEQFDTNAEFCQALKPAFDTLWNAAGQSHCERYNENGEWFLD